jgi:DNA-binding transcriptional MerR regulator
MTTRYTVRQLADLSGTSVRTLHHYDQIGLLVPAFLGENGYRYYGEPQLLRLQQILFHREFGISLREIGELLERPETDRVALLRQHRDRLQNEVRRYRLLVETIDRTIASINGEHRMKHEDLYRGFEAEQHAAYEAEAAARHGEDVVARSGAHYRSMTPEQRAAHMEELADLELAWGACRRENVAMDAPHLDALLARHRAWVAAMWDRPCPPDAYAGLADLYTQSPDFRARYETIEPGLADYLGAAMKAYAHRHGHISDRAE